MNLIIEAQKLVTQQAELKTQLENVFKDTETYEHEVRWSHYLAWASLGGRIKSSCWNGWDTVLDDEDVIGYDCVVHVDRYMTINLVEELDTLVEQLTATNRQGLGDLFNELEGDGFEVETAFDVIYKTPLVVELKEVLMRDAISSVFWDW